MSETIVPAGARSSSGSGLNRRWLALVGLVLIAAAAVVYLRGGHSENLTASGASTVGRVEGYQSVGGVTATSAHRILVVDYTVNKADYRARIGFDAGSPTYSQGQSVTVYYKASDPTDVQVDGHGNHSAKRAIVLPAGLLVLGLGLLGAGFADDVRRRFGK